MEVPLEEVIVVLPVDPYVEAQFFTQIIAMEQLLQYSRAELALMGVKKLSCRKIWLHRCCGREKA